MSLIDQLQEQTNSAHLEMLTRFFPSQNKADGFFATIKEQGAAIDRAWPLAIHYVSEATNTNTARDFLDSKAGAKFGARVLSNMKDTDDIEVGIKRAVALTEFFDENEYA